MTDAWLKGLKELREREPTTAQIDDLYEEVVREKNDRGAALIWAAQLEEGLERLIKSRLVTLSNERISNLFDYGGPMGSFSTKISVAFAFGIIDAEVRRNCDYIREIRNTFAHAGSPIRFETPEIKNACEQLSRWFTEYRDPPFPPDHPRMRFITAIVRLLQIFGDAKNAPDKTQFPIKWGDGST